MEGRSSFQGCTIVNTISNSPLTRDVAFEIWKQDKKHKGVLRYLSSWKKKSSCAFPSILWSRFLASSRKCLYSCKVSCNKHRRKRWETKENANISFRDGRTDYNNTDLKGMACLDIHNYYSYLNLSVPQRHAQLKFHTITMQCVVQIIPNPIIHVNQQVPKNTRRS